MKFLQCHIENYGCLSDFDFKFTDGLNLIFQGNGTGKSTFASFLCAMLYGLESTSKRNISDNERRHYKPWQGGIWGGYLDFSVQDRQYRAERHFGNKEREDTFVLYDLQTRQISSDYSCRLGYELFGIDKSGYQRSVYIPQGRIPSQYNDTVASRLSALLQNSDDLNQYEQAIASIDRQIRFYQKTGNRGEISRLEAQLSEYQIELNQLQNLADTEQRLYQELHTMEKQKQQYTKQLTQLSSMIEQARNQELSVYYQQLLAQKKQIIHSLEEADAFFHDSLPEEEDIPVLQDLCRQLSALEQNLKQTPQKPDTSCDSSAYQALERDFMNKQLLIEQEEQLLLNCRRRYQEEQKKAKLSSNDSIQTPKKSHSRLSASLLALTVFIFLIISLSSGLFQGIMWLFAGICITCIVSFYNSKKQTTDAQSIFSGSDSTLILHQIRQEISLHTSQLEELERQASEQEQTLLGYQKAMDSDTLKLKEYEKEVAAFKRLLKQKEALKTELIQYLEPFFDISSDDTSVSLNLKLQTLGNRLLSYKKNLNTLHTLSNDIQTFESQYAYPVSQQADLQTASYSELKKQELLLNKQYTEHLYKMSELRAELCQIKERRTAHCSLLEKADALNLQIKEYREKLRILQLTRHYLTLARQKFTNTYLHHLEKNLHHYTSLFSLDYLPDIHMDSDFQILIEEHGTLRSCSWYSQGIQDILYFCARMAIIHNLFPDEPPVLVLDDPFVNLDDDNFHTAQNVLKKLSSKIQILYYSCQNRVTEPAPHDESHKLE